MSSVSEIYWALADKADKKFVRLRDLPLYGGNKWDSFFQKAFQVYTKLWKYQQENRQALVDAGLQRWEIGEIASRIGQLYYNFYLRTSDLSFLSESYIFYEAIVSREYFKDTSKDPLLVNKQLRFIVRFIVVCLLLNRRDVARHLVRQFRALVDEVGRAFQSNDLKDWKHVVQEVIRFMKADAPCENCRPLRYSVLLDSQPNIFPPAACLGVDKPLKLKDALLASYHRNEVRFMELTLDTFRFLQCLEWEPSGSFYRPRIIGPNGATPGHPGPARVEEIMDHALPSNPHKYILSRPNIPQLLLVMATICEELPSDSIMFLYLSASGSLKIFLVPAIKLPFIAPPMGTYTCLSGQTCMILIYEGFPFLCFYGHFAGSKAAGRTGIAHSGDVSLLDALCERGPETIAEMNESSPSSSPLNSSPEVHSTGEIVDPSLNNPERGLLFVPRGNTGYLYPSDILPFTRRPLFVVIDSDNSCAFEVLHKEARGEEAVLLLSPAAQPMGNHVDSTKGAGSFFTLFLTAPLLGFCQLVHIPMASLTQAENDKVQKLFTSQILEWGKILAEAPLNPLWARVMWDPFLRLLLLRFIFCRACLRLHKLYGGKQEYSPWCLPPLPKDVSPSEKSVESCMYELASSLCVVDQFNFSQNFLDAKNT